MGAYLGPFNGLATLTQKEDRLPLAYDNHPMRLEKSVSKGLSSATGLAR
ncbi:MAG: hypothetical protein JWL77_4578 [Chthonomonadaceae bacterium]|nr:hypothetical protein [Chthonomonadaceae bacterium]